MKKILFSIILVALLGWGGYTVYKNHSSTDSTVPAVHLEPTVTHPDPSNASFEDVDGTITLHNGTATTNITGYITEDTTLTDLLAYGDINKDGKNDTAVILVQEGSGSGVFFRVAAYVSGVVQYKGSNMVFLGDRVSPKTISIDKGIITVTYLDRKENEPYTNEPTVLTTKTYAYTDSGLVENRP